jgi:hypothetical protein
LKSTILYLAADFLIFFLTYKEVTALIASSIKIPKYWPDNDSVLTLFPCNKSITVLEILQKDPVEAIQDLIRNHSKGLPLRRVTERRLASYGNQEYSAYK